MVGAGVPDTSHTSVVGCPADVKTLGSTTSKTGAMGGSGGGQYSGVHSTVGVLTEETCSPAKLDPALLSVIQSTKVRKRCRLNSLTTAMTTYNTHMTIT